MKSFIPVILITLAVAISLGNAADPTSKPAEDAKVALARLTISQQKAQEGFKQAEKYLNLVKSAKIVKGHLTYSDTEYVMPSLEEKIVRTKEAQDALDVAKAKLSDASKAVADYKASLNKPASKPATRPATTKPATVPASRPATKKIAP